MCMCAVCYYLDYVCYLLSNSIGKLYFNECDNSNVYYNYNNDNLF